VSPTGERCHETACLELHHDEAHARGGPATAPNLRLLCRSHNLLEAEEDFGRDLVQAKVRACSTGGTSSAVARAQARA
jgi:hypothetical protein